MNRPLTALFAAFEASLVVAIGIVIPLAPLTVLWGAQFGFAGDWTTFWRASVDIWLLGHGADVRMTLDPTVAATLGLAGADAAFPVTIAILGFGGLTLLLGVRAGRRVSETRFRLLGELVAVGTFAGLSTLATLSVLHPFARPSIVQGILLPTAVFGVGILIGSLRTQRAAGDDSGSSIRDWVNDWHPTVRSVVEVGLRGGVAAVAAVIAVASLAVAVLLAANYAGIVALYESLHSEVLGGIALTGAQLAFLPNVVIWAASWFVGPGFAIGAGSAVSPLGTTLGPLPVIPMLGALPAGDLAYGFLGLLVPIVAGFLAGALLRPRLFRTDWRSSLAAGASIGVVAGVLLGLLAWFSSGAAGPGRLAVVGPDPLAVGLWAALEVGIAATIGLFAASHLKSPVAEKAERADR
ncbi:hypothetical protein EYE40_10350 [Glaciihabitans arcticus]|uniref:Uncharacterized protein n=1 Tax=Glaciihabitans arcticus TaxID=2668039 RepID=A0A4Q9GSZ9_9MICO|nr:DUF6350 family protein [Glaciihabitans arcticus]TBN57755.1 hypothetical protein EYE40_10350 [Glaciihabitans arcticus]